MFQHREQVIGGKSEYRQINPHSTSVASTRNDGGKDYSDGVDENGQC